MFRLLVISILLPALCMGQYRPSGVNTPGADCQRGHWGTAVIASPPATPAVIDSYSESNKSGDLQMTPAGATIGGQTFSNTSEKTLLNCGFYLARVAGTTGTLTARVYAHTGTYGTTGTPDGSALASSDAIDISTLTDGYNLIEFTFSGANQITLAASTYYCVGLEFSGTGDIELGLDSSAPTHEGNSFFYMAGWYAYADADLCFYVTGQ